LFGFDFYALLKVCITSCNFYIYLCFFATNASGLIFHKTVSHYLASHHHVVITHFYEAISEFQVHQLGKTSITFGIQSESVPEVETCTTIAKIANKSYHLQNFGFIDHYIRTSSCKALIICHVILGVIPRVDIFCKGTGFRIADELLKTAVILPPQCLDGFEPNKALARIFEV
jgi:hypothetical protein